jgi:SAM-dependent methyltransferase
MVGQQLGEHKRKLGLLKSIMARLHEPVYDSRLRELTRLIVPHLRARDRVLDVGCGLGALGRAILDDKSCPASVQIHGLERARRDGHLIDIEIYESETLPYAERSYDVVILADVLHHVSDPDRLVAESIRVSDRLLIIKDHQLKGFLSYARVSLLDWAANTSYGVPCLYRYFTPTQWAELVARHGLRARYQLNSMRLYPPGYNFLFGGTLHYMMIAEVPNSPRKSQST